MQGEAGKKCPWGAAGRGARQLVALACALPLALWSPAARAEDQVIDRVIYVFDAPETGGAATPRVIFERELAFEARLEALASGEPLLDDRGNYAARHVRAALDRHIATDLLAHLPVESARKLPAHPCDGPQRPADESDLVNRVMLARSVLISRVRGTERLHAAVEAEGLNEFEVARMLRREAEAARYLDLMVTPMLAPSDAELREIHRTSGNPYHGKPFDQSRCSLRRWVIGLRLGTALTTFLQSSRMRVHLRRVP